MPEVETKICWVSYQQHGTDAPALFLYGVFFVSFINGVPVTAKPFEVLGFRDAYEFQNYVLAATAALVFEGPFVVCPYPLQPDGTLSFSTPKSETLRDQVRKMRVGGIIEGLDFSGCMMRDITPDWGGLYLEACNLCDANFSGCNLDSLSIDEQCNTTGCLIPIQAAPGVLWARNQK